MRDLFKSEQGFPNKEFEQMAIETIGHKTTDGASGSDWRWLFLNYKTAILPFIQQSKGNAEWVLFLFSELLIDLYTSEDIIAQNWDKISVRVLINSFLLGIACVKR